MTKNHNLGHLHRSEPLNLEPAGKQARSGVSWHVLICVLLLVYLTTASFQ